MMNENDLVSIIIPAYNTGSRVKSSLESVIAQDYENIEIIVVDDASSDNTGTYAHDILSESGRRYKIITHENNSGVSSSRNAGIENASGKYICFVDADDIIRVNFISSLHEVITHGQCDIAFCGLTDRFTDGRPDKNIHAANGTPYVSSGESFIFRFRKPLPPVWCCMYDSEFLRKYNILFHEGCTSGEDTEFITKALCRAKRVTFIDSCLYIYMHHNEMGSVRDNDTPEKRMLRYSHNTDAQFRTAEYILEHGHSKRLRDLAGNILMPQCVIRKFTLSAKMKDRAAYDSLHEDSRAINILHRAYSLYVLMRKPEIFVKAFMIEYLPGIYYMTR